MTDPADPFLVAALYRFARFDAPADIAAELREICARSGVMGSLIVAGEGINGTVAGTDAAIEALVAHLRTLPDCADMNVKYARAAAIPFARMKVKEKPEIVTLGAGELDPARAAGLHVEPADWNALIADPDTIVIDTRNSYEVALGSFTGAIDPHTQHFRHFPDWFDAQAAAWRAAGRTPRIAMFCTGGIRCEKSTALAKARGFEEVYHLKGGILRYLEEVPQEESLWQGDCFVFDRRVAVTHGLAPGGYAMCRPCGMPYPIGTAHLCEKDQGVMAASSAAS